MSAASPVLSASQIAKLAALGEERTAEPGDVLFQVGDTGYPFMAILEGEAVVRAPSGEEIVRHGAGGFLGELNLLSGQTVYLTATATQPMRYIAVERDALRDLLLDDSGLSDVLLGAFVARREVLQRKRVGVEVLGPHHSAATRELLETLARTRSVFVWRNPEEDEDAAARIAGLDDADLPLVLLPGGEELRAPSAGELSRALGIGLRLEPREEVDLAVVGGGPAGLSAAVYGASEGLSTIVVEAVALGGQAGSSRRIENYLGFPAGISGAEITSRAIAQARKFGARMASSYRVVGLEPGGERHVLRLDDGTEVAARAVVVASGADYRRLPVEHLDEYEGLSVFYAAGPLEAELCGASRVAVLGGGNSAAQAAIWLARGGALVTLLHRRADLRETMSAYLIADLERYGVAVRDRSEVAELHGEDGRLSAVTLKDGAQLTIGFLFCFLGAEPCADWMGGSVATDDHGFLLTGTAAGSETQLATSVPGIFAAGDIRAGSTKRVATAVGDGALAVREVHEHLERAETAPV